MQTELLARMALTKNGFRFTPSLGQNFLLDDEWNARIAEAAGVEPGQRILEIGPGAGTLTAAMAARGAEVLALEIDRTLEPVVQTVLAPYENARVVFADALKADLEGMLPTPYAVVANLPYYITSDILDKLLRLKNAPTQICVLVQKEFAERLCAHPGEKSYCALAALAQYNGRVERLLSVPGAAFTPPPHVESVLLRLSMFGADKPAKPRDEALFLRLLAAAFFMRRKTLLNNLCAVFGLEKPRAARVLEAAGLDVRVRGEALTLAECARLADEMAAESR